MAQEYVLFEKKEGVAILTMNRPERYNAMGFEMAEKMERRIEECFTDSEIKVLVITGSGKAFSSGGDMKAVKEDFSGDRKGFFRDLTKRLHRIITDIRLLPKPVIASINGPAGGAGFSLAMACDLRIASESARFKQAYTSMGLCPDGGWTVFVPAAIGSSKAMELLLTDPFIDAKQAHSLGIINFVVPDDQLRDKTWELAKKISKGPLFAFAKVKELINLRLFDLMEKQLERERQAIMECCATEDFNEALNAFFEKREAKFKGR